MRAWEIYRLLHGRSLKGPKGRFEHAAFCAVIRDENDPRKPAGYRSLEAFWTKRGYRPVNGLVGSYAWQEIGAVAETEKPMQFWMKRL